MTKEELDALLWLLSWLPAYFAIGTFVGWLWGRFMPEWDFYPVHKEGCDPQLVPWEDCSCTNCTNSFEEYMRLPKREKPLDGRVRDFWLVLFLWPLAVPLACLAALLWVVEKAIEGGSKARIWSAIGRAVERIVTWP